MTTKQKTKRSQATTPIITAAEQAQRQAEIETLFLAASAGYMRAYGQVHEIVGQGLFCWAGRLERAYARLATEPDNEKLASAVRKLRGIAERDFAEAEKAHADYVDLCSKYKIEPKEIEPGCKCEFCQRVPNGAEQLFALDVPLAALVFA